MMGSFHQVNMIEYREWKERKNVNVFKTFLKRHNLKEIDVLTEVRRSESADADPFPKHISARKEEKVETVSKALPEPEVNSELRGDLKKAFSQKSVGKQKTISPSSIHLRLQTNSS